MALFSKGSKTPSDEQKRDKPTCASSKRCDALQGLAGPYRAIYDAARWPKALKSARKCVKYPVLNCVVRPHNSRPAKQAAKREEKRGFLLPYIGRNTH